MLHTISWPLRVFSEGAQVEANYHFGYRRHLIHFCVEVSSPPKGVLQRALGERIYQSENSAGSFEDSCGQVVSRRLVVCQTSTGQELISLEQIALGQPCCERYSACVKSSDEVIGSRQIWTIARNDHHSASTAS